MNERTNIALKLIMIHIVIPIIISISTLFITGDSYLFFSCTQTVLLILFLTGYWEFFSSNFKTKFFAALEIILVIFFIHKISSQVDSGNNLLFLLILSLLQGWLLFILIKVFIVKYKNDKTKLEIEFPLRNGKYLITDGGNSKISRLMNYHYYSAIHKKNKTNNSMIYATDVVKIGKRIARFLPKQNEDYMIYNENIYSPMEGKVVKVENSINDNEPYIGKYPYNTGNTIVIQNGIYYFLLGHLKKGSVIVKEGELVKRSDLLGQVGNSGFSERPHLHMQLIVSNSENYWTGIGICIQYKGKNIYKNRIIKLL